MVIAGIPFTMPAIWIGLIVIFLVIEGLTAGLVTIWFAVGALAALIAAMFHAPLWLQLVWFFAVSIAAFAVTLGRSKLFLRGRISSMRPSPPGTSQQTTLSPTSGEMPSRRNFP